MFNIYRMLFLAKTRVWMVKILRFLPPNKNNPTSNISHLQLRVISSNPLVQFGKPWSVHKHLYKQSVKTLTKYVQTVFYLFIATKNYILPLSLFLPANISLLSLFYHPTESVFSAVFPAEQIIQWVLRGWVKSTAIQHIPISFTHFRMYFWGDFDQRSLFGTKLTAIFILIY